MLSSAQRRCARRSLSVPMTQNDSVRTLIGAPVVIAVLANDSSTSLTIIGYTQPIAGSLVLNPDQTFTYSPNAGFEGIDEFTYTVRDTIGGTASATADDCRPAGELAANPQGRHGPGPRRCRRHHAGPGERQRPGRRFVRHHRHRRARPRHDPGPGRPDHPLHPAAGLQRHRQLHLHRERRPRRRRAPQPSRSR